MTDEARLIEKTSRAAHALATGTGSIQQRIAEAAYHLCSLGLERDVPEWTRDQYAELFAALTKIQGRQGSIKATAAAMSDEEAQVLAGRIVSMYGDVCHHTGEETGRREARRKFDDEVDQLGEIG